MAKKDNTYTKKNSRLEAFLKKNTEVHFYERIRASEACIVISDKDSKAFKFVLLDNEAIYLLDNPPKLPKNRQAGVDSWLIPVVSLRDVASIELRNDFPEFLSGDERENVQHVVIKYRWQDKKERLKTTPSGTSLSAPATARSILAKNSSTTRSDSAFIGGTHSGDRNGSQSARHVQFNQSPDFLAMADDNNTDDVSPDGVHGIDTVNGFSGVLRLSLDKLETYDGQETMTVPPLNLGNGMDTTRTQNSEDLLTSTGRTGTTNNDGLPSPTTPRKSSGRLKKFLRQDKTRPPEAFQEAVDIGGKVIFRERTAEQIQAHTLTSLHLYIMDGASPFLSLAKGAWNNYIIQETLNFDDAFVIHRILATPRTGSNDSHLGEKINILFNQLRRDLMNPLNGLVEYFDYARELKSSAIRQFYIRKLFWKCADVFPFIINQLTIYLPQSPRAREHSLEPSNDDQKNQRADELEYCTLLLETLAVMFRETEILATRLHTLLTSRGDLLVSLLHLITCVPQCPGLEVNEWVKDCQRNLYQRQSSTARLLINEHAQDDMERLLDELHSSATSVVFEIFFVPKTNPFNFMNNFITTQWVVSTLQHHGVQELELFATRIALKCLQLLSPYDLTPLTPLTHISLYHHLIVLREFFLYFPSTLDLMKAQFTEEFRYYIQPRVIQFKLSRDYPVHPYLIQVLQDVVDKITRGRSNTF